MSFDLNSLSRDGLIAQVKGLRDENADLQERTAQLTEKINKQEERIAAIKRKFENEMKSLHGQIKIRDRQIIELESGQPPRKSPRSFHAKWRQSSPSNSASQTLGNNDVGLTSTFVPILSPHGSTSSMTPSPSPVNSSSTETAISTCTPELEDLLTRCYGLPKAVASEAVQASEITQTVENQNPFDLTFDLPQEEMYESDPNNILQSADSMQTVENQNPFDSLSTSPVLLFSEYYQSAYGLPENPNS